MTFKRVHGEQRLLNDTLLESIQKTWNLKKWPMAVLRNPFFPSCDFVVWLRSEAYLRHFHNEQEVNFLIAFLESNPVFQISRFFFPKAAEKQNLP